MTTTEPDIPRLKQTLDDPAPSIRFNAGLDLVKAGDTSGVLALIELFNHESHVLRIFHAARALVDMGDPGVPFLLDALEDGTIRYLNIPYS